MVTTKGLNLVTRLISHLRDNNPGDFRSTHPRMNSTTFQALLSIVLIFINKQYTKVKEEILFNYNNY